MMATNKQFQLITHLSDISQLVRSWRLPKFVRWCVKFTRELKLHLRWLCLCIFRPIFARLVFFKKNSISLHTLDWEWTEKSSTLLVRRPSREKTCHYFINTDSAQACRPLMGFQWKISPFRTDVRTVSIFHGTISACTNGTENKRKCLSLCDAIIKTERKASNLSEMPKTHKTVDP